MKDQESDKEKFKAALERKSGKTSPVTGQWSGENTTKSPNRGPSSRKMFRRKSGS